MSKYPTHSNPTAVYCAECGLDITLHGQYILDCKVLCGDCNERHSDGVDNATD